MTTVVALYNIKGGVGKTSAAVNLAWLAASQGARTLLWDLDPQGAATFLLRIKPKVKGGARKLVGGKTDAASQLRAPTTSCSTCCRPTSPIANGSRARRGEAPDEGLARVLAPLASDYEFIFLDCPPAISLASESVFGAADVLLVPLIPSPLSLRTFDQLREFVTTEVAKPPGIFAFFSMADGRKRLHREVIEELTAANDGVLSTVIPAASDVERMALHRRVLAQTAPRGRAAGSRTKRCGPSCVARL